MENYFTVYRIIGRFHNDEKPHILAGGLGHPIKTLEEAKRTKDDIIANNKRDVLRGKSIMPAGYFSVECEVTPDYLLEDVRIQSSKRTPWIDEKI